MNEVVMNLKLKKKKEREFREKKGRLNERKGFGVKMIENRDEIRGD